MSCGWMSSITKESTPAFSFAVPIKRKPGTDCSRFRAVGQQSCSCAAMASRPIGIHVVDRRAQADRRRRCAACRLQICTAAGCRVVFSKVTELIMSPPPWYGGIASSSSALPYSTPIAGRPVHFVAGEGVEIAIELLHIDRHVRDSLRAIDQHAGIAGGAPSRRSRAIGFIVPSAFETWAMATNFVFVARAAFRIRPAAVRRRR